MGTLDELPVALDDLLNRHLLNGIQGEDVVRSRLNNDMGHPALGQHVAVKSRSRVGTEGIVKQPVAGQSFVQHAHGPMTGLRQQPPGELVGPSGVGVHG